MTALVLNPASASATADVQEVVSPGGIRAYLVHAPAVPLLALSLHFEGGSALDPDGKEGLAYMASGLLDEGAGTYDSQAFRAELENNAIRLSFDADRDGFTGELQTLNETREHAFELLRLALSEPRFDEEPVERIRQQIIAGLKRRMSDPQYRASLAWFTKAFDEHPYGRPIRGTEETIAAIETADLVRFVQERLARGNLSIGVSGDITPEELAPLLDKTFGDLPDAAQESEVETVEPMTDELVVDRMDIPQSVVSFGTPGIERHDPDYYAGYVANYILGGGGFSSRLLEEIREKRGLAYSAYSYLYQLDASPLWIGGVATRNDQVARSIDLVREQASRMAAGDISEGDLENAKTYLTGSFPLRLTSNSSVARVLTAMQTEDLGLDYLERRNDLIEAVTLDDVVRVSKRLYTSPPLVAVVGDPQGLEDAEPVRLPGALEGDEAGEEPAPAAAPAEG